MISRRLQILFALIFTVAIAGTVGAQAPNPPAQTPLPPHPGIINYVEGSASIGSQALGPKSPGFADIEQGQTLTTGAGKVEVLLTPGVFLRVDDNSSVKMVSPDLANTEIAVVSGLVSVEVLDIGKNNNVRIDLNDSNTRLLDKGLYEFDAGQDQVRVFKGRADVFAGSQKVTLKNEREVTLNAGGKLKGHGFDSRKEEDAFFRWCAIRSGYLAEASVDEAREYVGPAGSGWYGPNWSGTGWYWDPYYFGYTFLPADGIFYSPFGWGFYSPIFVYRSPFWYGGVYGRGPHAFGEFHGPYGHGFEPQGGFHGGGGFHAGGGFHGGGGFGGGFHGGGGGGRR